MNIPVNNDVTTIAENFKHVILFLQKGKSEVCSTMSPRANVRSAPKL